MIKRNKWLIEFVWILITFLLIILVIWPIRSKIYQFPFERSNIYFILVCVTGLRWFLFLPSTPFAKNMWIKLILLFGSVWMGIYQMNRFAEFQAFIDEKGIESLTIHLSESEQLSMAKYITSEYIFFAVGAIIACILLPFRMVVSIWRTFNKDTV